MKKAVTRQSNFELLRIISMFMIVGLHYFNGSMGGALAEIDNSSPNYYVAFLFESLFIVSVGCFILITGYFSINKKSINLNKVVELLVQMDFRSNRKSDGSNFQKAFPGIVETNSIT